MRRRILAVAAVTVLAFVSAVGSAGAAPGLLGAGYRAALAYTEYGVPHIVGRDLTSAGYGYGYGEATDNLCVLADVYLTVRGDRSRFLGPQGKANQDLVSVPDNLSSDAYFRYLASTGAVDRSLAAPAPTGPLPQVRALVHGYVQGYNAFLASGRLADPACKGKPWLRPITDKDVYSHVYALSLLTGSGVLAGGIVGAHPAATAATAVLDQHRLTGAVRAMADDHDLGSNAIAIGRAGTRPGVSSVLLGNPHYPWQGPRRFWQAQLSVPGQLDVSGASLLGVPLVLIGHNADVAWSHTVATARTFGLFENPTVPGDPTSYLVGGVKHRMGTTTVSVPVGSGPPVRRTVYTTTYGPVVTAGPGGVPLPWGRTVFSLRDANIGNLRLLNTWYGLDTARDTGAITGVLSRTQGLPWVNTLATDRAGHALYADIQSAPGVTDPLVARCGTAAGKQLYQTGGLAILDGSRADCDWSTDRDSVAPGLLGPSRQPRLTRADFVTNSNDSAWLANPAQPLTGYPRTIGDIGTPRSLRTQQGILSVQRRIAGTDGLPGKGFDVAGMRSMLFGDASRAAELAAKDAARMCAAFPGGMAPSSSGPVDVTGYCAPLASWNGRSTVDSKGSLLFQRFILDLPADTSPWTVPFDPAHPVTTPNTLNTASPAVQRAFGTAVADLRGAHLAPDAPLGAGQNVTRNGRVLPIHGAPGQTGTLDVITPAWDPAHGNTDVVHGSSFIQVIGFTPAGPQGSTLLTYAQSTDPTSPHYADQTALFSRGQWVPDRFTLPAILSSPALRIVALR